MSWIPREMSNVGPRLSKKVKQVTVRSIFPALPFNFEGKTMKSSRHQLLLFFQTPRTSSSDNKQLACFLSPAPNPLLPHLLHLSRILVTSPALLIFAFLSGYRRVPPFFPALILLPNAPTTPRHCNFLISTSKSKPPSPFALVTDVRSFSQGPNPADSRKQTITSLWKLHPFLVCFCLSPHALSESEGYLAHTLARRCVYVGCLTSRPLLSVLLAPSWTLPMTDPVIQLKAH